MVWEIRLLIASAIVIASVFLGDAAGGEELEPASSCAVWEVGTQACTAGNLRPWGIEIEGTESRSGSDSISGETASGDLAQSIEVGGESDPPVPPTLDFCSPTDPTDCTFTGAEPEPPPAGEPAVTLRDIASFRPAAPGDAMEPGGWAVVGLPANFVAEASVQTLSGTLLGRSADVRVHPVAYRWAHSDGATVQSSVPGATWEELGQAEFTETETSHVYATSGEYTAELAVVYVAEYRFDGSAWRWIDGTLAIAGEPRTVLVGEFDTVLVTGDCTVAPDGPGCG